MARTDGAIYWIIGNPTEGYFWKVSRAGSPGDQSDLFPTANDAENDVKSEYPGALFMGPVLETAS